jgi:hypothetical protein
MVKFVQINLMMQDNEFGTENDADGAYADPQNRPPLWFSQ